MHDRDAVLNWINVERAKLGGAPLDSIPPNDWVTSERRTRSCPIALAFKDLIPNCTANGEEIYEEEVDHKYRKGGISIQCPQFVAAFIDEMDHTIIDGMERTLYHEIVKRAR